MSKFRVLRGQHTESEKTDGTPRVYSRGDVLESKTDLLRHNSRAGEAKFERVGDDAETTSDTGIASCDQRSSNTLDDMTVEELRTLAAEEEIDLSESKTKRHIIAAILAAHKG